MFTLPIQWVWGRKSELLSFPQFVFIYLEHFFIRLSIAWISSFEKCQPISFDHWCTGKKSSQQKVFPTLNSANYQGSKNPRIPPRRPLEATAAQARTNQAVKKRLSIYATGATWLSRACQAVALSWELGSYSLSYKKGPQENKRMASIRSVSQEIFLKPL